MNILCILHNKVESNNSKLKKANTKELNNVFKTCPCESNTGVATSDSLCFLKKLPI